MFRLKGEPLPSYFILAYSDPCVLLLQGSLSRQLPGALFKVSIPAAVVVHLEICSLKYPLHLCFIWIL